MAVPGEPSLSNNGNACNYFRMTVTNRLTPYLRLLEQDLVSPNQSGINVSNPLTFSVTDIMLRPPPNPDTTVQLSTNDFLAWAAYVLGGVFS